MRLFDLIHSAVTAGMAILFSLIDMAWLGGLLGAWGFIFREQAQAEYRWIERYGSGLRANLPWWGAFDPRVWDRHSLVFNLALPVVVAVSVIVL